MAIWEMDDNVLNVLPSMMERNDKERKANITFGSATGISGGGDSGGGDGVAGNEDSDMKIDAG